MNSVCGGEVLVRPECSPVCRFGWCDGSSAMGVPRSCKGELLGWICVVFFLVFSMLVLRVVGGVVGAAELVFVIVLNGVLLGVVRCLCL